jgi:hypothetical protein
MNGVARPGVRRIAVAAAIAALWPAAAAANTPTSGVHIDPNSPVAKEYSFPLANARGATAGTGDTGPLFGGGVTKRAPGATAGSSSTSGSSSSSTTLGVPPRGHRRPSRARPGRALSPTSPVRDIRTASATAPSAMTVLHSGGGSAVAWMIGLAAAVLVLGGLGGYALSGRSRKRSASVS